MVLPPGKRFVFGLYDLDRVRYGSESQLVGSLCNGCVLQGNGGKKGAKTIERRQQRKAKSGTGIVSLLFSNLVHRASAPLLATVSHNK